MAFYLHGFMPKDVNGISPTEDTVFCSLVQAWEIEYPAAITGAKPHLLVLSICGAGEPPAPDDKPRLTHLPLHHGCRYYVVENDPEQVQRPNGPIVWRWEGEAGETAPFASQLPQGTWRQPSDKPLKQGLVDATEPVAALVPETPKPKTSFCGLLEQSDTETCQDAWCRSNRSCANNMGRRRPAIRF